VFYLKHEYKHLYDMLLAAEIQKPGAASLSVKLCEFTEPMEKSPQPLRYKTDADYGVSMIDTLISA
jgi:hypothetical protein